VAPDSRGREQRESRQTPRSKHWRWIGRAAFVAFLVLVAVLIARHASRIEWGEVRSAVAAYDARTLGFAAALTTSSYLLYAAYDIAARRYVGHDVGTARVTGIALISYAFNLNLGALIGGAAFRYRLYTQAGVGGADVGRVLGFAVAANWLGYSLVAGVLFALRLVPVPSGWEVGLSGLQVIGVILLVLCAAYFLACLRWHGKVRRIRGHEVTLPTPGLAAVQFSVAAANWMVIAWIHFVLLGGRVDYPALLGATLLAAIAAAMTHIPAGIGALEAVFLALLASRVGEPSLVAALLVYRAIYYIGPLVLALAGYGAMELASKRARRPAKA
jgi:glycosyltransferase 2 family protein